MVGKIIKYRIEMSGTLNPDIRVFKDYYNRGLEAHPISTEIPEGKINEIEGIRGYINMGEVAMACKNIRNLALIITD